MSPADEEVRRRAEQCIQAIERIPHAARTMAVARLLGVRRPDGAAEVLLAYLPSADWRAVGEDLLGPLSVIGLKGDPKNPVPDPAILAAATDKDPIRRTAAAHVLGHAGAEHRMPLTKLLADESPQVRYHAALALVRARDARGLPVLVALLGDGPLELAWRAEDLLARVAGEASPPSVGGAPDNAESRKKWHTAWQGWWNANGKKLDLARFNLEEALLGITVVCEIGGVGQGQVSEFDRGGRLLWNIEVTHPNDVQRLRSGHVLVAEHGASRVTERDRKGQIVWERKLAGAPTCAERLRNGNTLMATYNEIVEVTPDGRNVLAYKHAGGMIYCTTKLPGGNVLFIDSTGKVAELDATGKEVHTFKPQQYTTGAGYWASIEPLRSGRYLISLGGAGKVVETDRMGKVLWECSVPTPTYATRLPNGNTLVASVDRNYVVEVDRDGKEKWKKTVPGRPFRARRY
jgi:hypothetical protein